MGEPTVECYNCGRENPGWAQICRTCGVSLRGAERFASGPPPRLPTDTNSLISMAAAVGTIVAAIVVGLVLSSLDPSEGVASGTGETPTPTLSAAPTATTLATVVPTTVPTAAPTPSPVPLPGELLIGTALDPNTRRVSTPQATFAPGDNFAYSLTMPEAIGTNQLFVEVVQIEEDGTETVRQEPTGAQAIDGSQPTAAFEIPANILILGPDGTAGSGDEFGPGRYLMRIYLAADELVAEAPFELTE